MAEALAPRLAALVPVHETEGLDQDALLRQLAARDLV